MKNEFHSTLGLKMRGIIHLSDDVVQYFCKILLLSKSGLKVGYFFSTVLMQAHALYVTRALRIVQWDRDLSSPSGPLQPSKQTRHLPGAPNLRGAPYVRQVMPTTEMTTLSGQPRRLF